MSELVFTRKKIKTDRSLPKGLINQKKFVIRRSAWAPFLPIINSKLVFKSKILNLFFLLWKFNLQFKYKYYGLKIYKDQIITFFRKTFYILIRFLVSRSFFFMQLFWVVKSMFFYFESFFVSWNLLLIVHLFFRTSKNFYLNSKFLTKPRLTVLHYADFKVSVKMSNFLNLGQYVEYFRLFKYFEYIKRCSDSVTSPQLKNCFRKLMKFKWPLWKLYRWNAYPLEDEDDDIFRIYDCNVGKNILPALQFKNLFLNFKWFFIRWPFFISSSVQRLGLHLYYHFFSVSFMLFIYKCLYFFKRALALFLKFKNTSPRDMFRFFKRARFKFTKWIIIYYLRYIWQHEQFIKINYFFFVNLFQYKMFYVIDLMLIEYLSGDVLRRLVAHSQKMLCYIWHLFFRLFVKLLSIFIILIF